MIEIKRLTSATPDTVADINALMDEFHGEGAAQSVATLEEIERIVHDPNVGMITVQDGEKVVGVATVYLLWKVGKRTSHLEDVVVSSAYRGQGLGEKLVLKAMEFARESGTASMSLTSRTARVAANKLYQKLGFVIKETNSYTMKF